MSTKSVSFLYLSQEDVLRTGIGMPQVLDEVERVLSLHEEGKVNLPSKIVLDLGERERGRINAMPAYIGGEYDVCGIKWISGFPGNPSKNGMPRASAIIVLNNSWTGLPLAIMDGTYISAMRTGAVTGVGAKYLARKNSNSIGLIGCGVQAFTQILALRCAMSDIREVKAYDKNPMMSNLLKREIEKKMPISVRACDSPFDAVEGADIVVTATVADEPIVKEKWLKEGCLFTHVGSYQEEEEEVIIKADKIVVDIWEEVLHRGTPLVARLYKEGKITASSIYANIGAIITGKKPGRENQRERIFYSPMGLGSEDIAVAWRIYGVAKEKKLGTLLNLWKNPVFDINPRTTIST